MDTTKRWSVQIYLDEHEDGSTRAEAVLDSHTGRQIRAVGQARCNPHDVNIPEIGDELAAARALLSLADDLLNAAAKDVESVTRESVRLAQR